MRLGLSVDQVDWFMLPMYSSNSAVVFILYWE